MWLDSLTDCKVNKVHIEEDPRIQKQNKIMSVPTIVIYKDGVEVKRYKSNIMMKLEATREEVQKYINEIKK